MSELLTLGSGSSRGGSLLVGSAGLEIRLSRRRERRVFAGGGYILFGIIVVAVVFFFSFSLLVFRLVIFSFSCLVLFVPGGKKNGVSEFGGG